MKKIIVLVLTMLLLLSNMHVTESAGTIKVLVDESRVYSQSEAEQKELIEGGVSKSADWSFSFGNYDQFWGYGYAAEEIQKIASLDIKSSGTISYSTLKNYDVLIIASLSENYSSEEVDAIKKFVENGGGLLLLAGPQFSNNKVSLDFNVLFRTNAVIADESSRKPEGLGGVSFSDASYFYVDNITDHPLTKGIEKIVLLFGIPILNFGSGKVLARTSTSSWADDGDGIKQADEDSGPFDILVAMENIGKGRAVFFGGSFSFFNIVAVSEEGNLDFLTNAVKWLGEPGGPYKQYKAINGQAQQKLPDALSLYNSNSFSQAQTAFENAAGLFERSNATYENADAIKGIEDTKAFIEKCKTGVEADQTFERALSFFNSGEYEKATGEFGKAKSLYEEIECVEKANECTICSEATQEFQKAEEALTKAPSTFSAAGYEEATYFFERAKNLWERYNHSPQVAACTEKITQCDNEIATIKKNVKMIAGGVVAAVAVVIVIIVFLRRRKPRVAEKPSPKGEELPEKPSPKGEELPEETGAPPGAEAADILREGYAKGTFTKEEYEKLMSSLKK